MAAVNFTRKRVESLTLGEKLKKIRNDRRISLAEVARATKIQAKYLEALENGEYEKLPPEVYVRGFLRSYASFLDIPEDAILKLYDREKRIQRNLGKIEQFHFQPATPIRFSSAFSSKTVAVLAVSLVAFGFFAYLYIEFQSFVSEPRLAIFEPLDGMTVTDAEIVVRGETDVRAMVTINGEGTIVDERGSFSETLRLTPGFNAIEVSSINRFGEKRTRTISVNAALSDFPEAGIFPADVILPNEVRISIYMKKKAVVSVKADGEAVFSGELAFGETKAFSAKDEIIISSSVGNAVAVKFKDEAEVNLSDFDAAADAVFRVDGRQTTVEVIKE